MIKALLYIAAVILAFVCIWCIAAIANRRDDAEIAPTPPPHPSLVAPRQAPPAQAPPVVQAEPMAQAAPPASASEPDEGPVPENRVQYQELIPVPARPVQQAPTRQTYIPVAPIPLIALPRQVVPQSQPPVRKTYVTPYVPPPAPYQAPLIVPRRGYQTQRPVMRPSIPCCASPPMHAFQHPRPMRGRR
jgi:hypothetical protein